MARFSFQGRNRRTPAIRNAENATDASGGRRSPVRRSWRPEQNFDAAPGAIPWIETRGGAIDRLKPDGILEWIIYLSEINIENYENKI
jgi:hypothetical protein